ncbi:MAG TPA: phosphatase PAP2 family protein [archaeon]|nr:phosphatase PAP2 family protein [archaeon]
MKFDFRKTTCEVFAVIMRDTSAYGGFPFYGMMIIAFFLLGELDFTYNLVVSLITVTIVVALVRLAYFKPRPGMKRKTYATLYERIDNSSFPSIHAARAVMISMALFSKFSALLPLLTLMTILVLMTRIYFKRHDATDLTVGVIIGLILGIVFF